MAIFGDFLHPVSLFSASRVQHISDLHSKFACTKATSCAEVWYTSSMRPLRLGEEKRKKEEEDKKHNCKI